MIAYDKALHLAAGLIIYSFIAIINPLAALMITIAVGVCKELYDEWNYGGFDWKDLWFTVSIPIILYLLQGVSE